MTFDPTKPVQTRDGRKARIVCTDRDVLGRYPIVALVTHHTGGETIETFTSSGEYRFGRTKKMDLINIPVKHERWVNVYGVPKTTFLDTVHLSRSEADRPRSERPDRIACIKIEFEEGEGL